MPLRDFYRPQTFFRPERFWRPISYNSMLRNKYKWAKPTTLRRMPTPRLQQTYFHSYRPSQDFYDRLWRLIRQQLFNF